MATIEIPAPLITVTTEEAWRDAGIHGYRDYTVTIAIRDTVLLRDFYTDWDESNHRITAEDAEERTVTKFAERLREVLAFDC